MPMRRRGHRRLARTPAPTPADAFEDAAFALCLISAAAIADTMLALLIVL